MNVQIFGTNKSFDTKKAQRWFKERRIKFQMVDLKEKGLSRGEFDRVCQAVGGWQALVDETAKDQDTLALLRAQLLSGKSLSDGDGERSYYVGACAESGFSLILQQPQTYTAQVVRSIYLVAALMGALCLVLCLVCAWWLSRRLFEPVNELDGAMRRVEGGDYDVRIESTRQDEMGRLAASFDRMTAEYRQNLERSVQRERELNETRLRMLQSQLNPHFLYNTLDCMKWLGVTGGVPQVAELAADLAALLRAGISGSEYITLEEELELIGRYLAIQEVRFGDRHACCVILASKGYPVKYESGCPITLPETGTDEQIYVAGARRDGERLLSAGGRVLGVTAVRDTLAESIDAAYALTDKADFENGFCRRDIGQRALSAARQSDTVADRHRTDTEPT